MGALWEWTVNGVLTFFLLYLCFKKPLEEYVQGSKLLHFKPKTQTCITCDRGVYNQQSSNSPKVCLMQPIKINQDEINAIKKDGFMTLSALNIFLKSVLDTVPLDGSFTYGLYFGFNFQDLLFCNCELMKGFHEKIQRMIGEAPVEYHNLPIPGSEKTGLLTYYWNIIAQYAYADGCDYYFPSNDDVRLLGKGWLEVSVAALKTKCRHGPNLGIVTYKDLHFESMEYTFHLLHRTHLEINNMVYYKTYSVGAHQDPWAYSVYQQIGCSFVMNDSYTVRNTGREKQGRDASGRTIRSNAKYDYGCSWHLRLDVIDGLADLKKYFEDRPIEYPRIQLKEFIPGKRDLHWFVQKMKDYRPHAAYKCKHLERKEVRRKCAGMHPELVKQAEAELSQDEQEENND